MESRPALDRPAARLARMTGLACVGLVLAIAAAYYMLPLIRRALVGVVELVVAGFVWVATSIGEGVSMWDVLATIARATIGLLVTPAGSIGISILVVIGIMALYWLQRLLESEEESSS
jgi:hypothetical protein